MATDDELPLFTTMCTARVALVPIVRYDDMLVDAKRRIVTLAHAASATVADVRITIPRGAPLESDLRSWLWSRGYKNHCALTPHGIDITVHVDFMDENHDAK